MESKLKASYNYYAGLGKKEGMENFKSVEFAKLVGNAGLIINKNNKFNLKPPNRVDYVFVYACTNGPGGMRGNKSMTLQQLAFACKGIAKETGKQLEEVVDAISNVKVQFDSTQAESTRFHDDASNYTGVHKKVHAANKGEAYAETKEETRRARAKACLSGVDLKEAEERRVMVETTFAEADNGDGLLDATELRACLKKLKPNASDATLKYVHGWVMKAYDENNDGLLSLGEFINAFNQLVDVLAMMGDSDVTPEISDLVKQKYLSFTDCTPGNKREEEMDSARFKKFCQDTFPMIFRKNQEGTTKCDVIFANMVSERREKDPKANKVTFSEFYSIGLMQILGEINKEAKAKVTMDQVLARVLQSMPKTDATEAGYNRFHDDKDGYTGSHSYNPEHGAKKKTRSIKAADW